MALGLSRAFAARLLPDRAGSPDWLSDGFRGFPSATQIIPNTLPATFNRSISTGYISYNSLKGMIVNVLIDIKITEVIKGRRVVEFPRDKFIPEIR